MTDTREVTSPGGSAGGPGAEVSAAALDGAAAVLRENDRGGFTVPCPTLYPAQWLWDAGFNALGWATLDEARAFDELDRLLVGQWADGMCPHIVFFEANPSYFPGPSEWGTDHDPPTSGITQPPVLASVLARLVEEAADVDQAERRANALWDRVWANHRWWHTARDPEGSGLVCLYHPWESGMDDSPAWDDPLSRVETGDLPAFLRRDLEVVAAAERPTDRDYDRFYALVLEGRALGWEAPALWHEASFRVVDVLTNALLVRADTDLARLGRRLGKDEGRCEDLERWAALGAAGLERLWDEEAGHYRSIDLNAHGAFCGPATVASLIAAWSGALSAGRVAQLAAAALAWCEATGAGLPSVEPGWVGFDPVHYWRGASWQNTTWLAARGFADAGETEASGRLAQLAGRLVENAGFAEYFDPCTGAAHGCRGFSTTASLTLAWLAG